VAAAGPTTAAPRLLRYAALVTTSLRRSSLVLLWLLLALLPLRGWAHVTMHLQASGTPAAAPCHGSDAQAAAEPADTAKPCTLCDVCHGVMLLLAGSAAQGDDRRAQPLPGALPAAAPAAEADALFRPPRR
jgi:hypothetical protein